MRNASVSALVSAKPTGVAVTLLMLFGSAHSAPAQQPRPSPEPSVPTRDSAPAGRRQKKKLVVSPEFKLYAGRDASNRLIFGAGTRTEGQASSAVAAHDRGVRALGAGEYEQAARAFGEAIKLSPDWADARYGLGTAYAQLGEHEKAIGEFTEVLDSGGADELLQLWAHYGIGNARFDAGEYAQAAEAYRRAVTIRPGLSKPHNNLGLALVGSGDGRGALAEFREAVRLNPDYAEARFNLGVLSLELGDKEGAAEQERRLRVLNAELADRLNRRLRE